MMVDVFSKKKVVVGTLVSVINPILVKCFKKALKSLFDVAVIDEAA